MTILISTLYPLLCMMLPCIFYIFLQKRKPGVCLSGPHFIWVLIFLLYLYMVLEATGIGTIWDIGKYDGIISVDKINLIPFTDITGFSQSLNIIMFMPLGFLLPFIWKEFRSPLKVLLAGAGYSFGIEFCQLFNNRVTDIDDLIMNTLGAVAGYVIWIIFVCLFHPKGGKREISLSGKEAAVYLVLSMAGEFFLFNWRWMVRTFFM
ncbi:VanZ family protein [Clostridium sp. AF19-22AC]|jgi:glycopeptide antibiotics resistance protein|uniref:VanZ like protein n=1 Tax=Faecalicatena orotica TaxID=1544 RepID=A0A2Y9BIQ3_9FIRM|nr:MULTISPECIES: VanZ family protein [Clostridia]PWJ23157.1 VanZ like protein [Faecalicatena orotica]RHR29458.1 VanZ family protein [Clostridium sp. AF19-22AC]SSA57894.1 VanZ like family protein [Faecalicatena orotica]